MERRPPTNLHPDLLPHIKLFPYIVPIIPQVQKKLTWCGAACESMMLIHATGNNKHDYKQESIWWWLGEGNGMKVDRQVDFARRHVYKAYHGQVNQPEKPGKLRSFFKRLVNEYKIPIEILYPSDENGVTGHFVLVVGANEKNLLVVDPAPGYGVSTYNYDELAPWFSYDSHDFYPGTFMIAYNQDMVPWMPEATRY